jgi:hypothetical protein
MHAPLDRTSIVTWVWAELRVVLTVARHELLLETRYRNKFALDLVGHFLGLAPILVTAWAFSGGERYPQGFNVMQGVHDYIAFLMLGYAAFLAIGLGNPILQYTGITWSLESKIGMGVLERSLLAPVTPEAVVLGIGLYYVTLYLFHIATTLAAGLIFLRIELILT